MLLTSVKVYFHKKKTERKRKVKHLNCIPSHLKIQKNSFLYAFNLEQFEEALVENLLKNFCSSLSWHVWDDNVVTTQVTPSTKENEFGSHLDNYNFSSKKESHCFRMFWSIFIKPSTYQKAKGRRQSIIATIRKRSKKSNLDIQITFLHGLIGKTKLHC